MLATHLSSGDSEAEIFLSPHTVKSQAMFDLPKLGASHGTRRSPGLASWGSWRADDRSFSSIG